MFVSLSCTVTVQETTASSLKPSLLRASFAPQKGPRRSLDVSAHVLATPVASHSDHSQPIPTVPPSTAGVSLDASHAYWTPAWTKALQTKFLAVWERWQKLSANISQYKALRPDWVGHTQEVFDQRFQRFLSSITTATAARPAVSNPAAGKPRSGTAGAIAARPVTLTPYLTVADEVEVSFAAMLADLCNMAYEVDKIDPELLEARHRLSLIATSITCGGQAAASCVIHASDAAAAEAQDSTSMGSAAIQGTTAHHSQPTRGGKHAGAPGAAAAGSRFVKRTEEEETVSSTGRIVSFTLGGSPPLSPSISMLQLTSPEAVTAALTSQGHGAAFAHPVYVSTLHHALTSLGSYDEEGDISDLEWRAAMAAAGPRALLVGPGGGATAPAAAAAGASAARVGAGAGTTMVRGPEIGSLGTIATLDELLLAPELDSGLTPAGLAHDEAQPARVVVDATALAAAAAGMQDQHVVPGQTGGAAAVQLASATVATLDIVTPGGGGAGAGGSTVSVARPPTTTPPAGVFFSDANLSEERDFLSGHVYGYKTKLVPRRASSDGATADSTATAAAAAGIEVAEGEEAVTTRRGAAGGRALRAEQEHGGRRRSTSGGGGVMASGAGVASVGGAGAEALGAAAEGVHGVEMPASMADVPPVVVASARAPPSAWFAADDKLTKTRFFVIQGSTSLEHWQINLQFEPVVFEDPKYGVRVHRGVYEAAKVLYDDLLPLVQQHIETSPYASVSFSDHSLGGSLGTALMLLFVVRGVLKPANISPVYTFGAPAIFCQGAVPNAPPDRCANCTLSCHMRSGAAAAADGRASAAAVGAAAAAATGDGGPFAGLAAAAASMEQEHAVPLGLMASLGLSEDLVVNVIMHKDIVPRAFVCDYTMVAGVLHRWWPSLREHAEFQGGKGAHGGPHKSLYNFVGRMAVLRPTHDLPFVNGPADAAHPMLPNHPALYRVGLPNAHPLPSLDTAAASMASWDELLSLERLSSTVSATLAAATAAGCRRAAASGLFGAAAAAAAAEEAKRAAKLAGLQRSVLHFMNQPHPLTTLGDYQAYGPHGCISRFHNPDNYTRALQALMNR